MPKAQRWVGAVLPAPFMIITLLTMPISAYSSESHIEKYTRILGDNTKEILGELDKVNPSPKPNTEEKETRPAKTKPKGVDKNAIAT